MKLLVSFLLAGLVTFQAKAQSDTNSVFTFVEQMPEFPGGQSALLSYLNTHMVYPQAAEVKGIGARVVVRFVIWKDGSIRHAEIVSIRPDDPGNPDFEALKNEALRIVNSMPKWKPGKQNGRSVNTYYTLPVKFSHSTTVSGMANEAGPEVPPPPPVSGSGENEVFVMVEQMPEFPGGNAALRKYLVNNLRYPQEVLSAGIDGRIFVQFTVTREGKIKDAKVVKSCPQPACLAMNQEALRVVNNMPLWKPGKQNGRAVNVRYNLPVLFKLPADEVVPGPKTIEGQSNERRQDDQPEYTDQQPQFPGGQAELLKYVGKNFQYPDAAKKERAHGKVTVSFTVTSDGNIRDAKVLRQNCMKHSTDEACEAMKKEALRIVNQMPKWEPGRRNGQSVDMTYTLPIGFELEK